MDTSTVSDKYQVVIPRSVRKTLKLRRGVKVRWTALSDGAALVQPGTSNRLDWAKRMRGLGKEIWQGVDAQKYVEKERRAWTRREKRLGIV